MSISRVQLLEGDSATAPSGTASATWGPPTATGSLLVAQIFARATGTNVPTFTFTGWTPLTRRGAAGGSNQDPSGQVFYIPNAASRSGAESLSLSASSSWIMYLAEYSGVATASPFDVEAGSSNGTGGTLPDTGSVFTNSANELWLAGIAAKNRLRSFSLPTNGYTLVRQDATADTTASNGIAACYLEQLVSATADAHAGASINTTAQYLAQLATFTQAAAGGGGAAAYRTLMGVGG